MKMMLSATVVAVCMGGVEAQSRRDWKELRNSKQNRQMPFEPIPLWNNFRELQPLGDWRKVYRSEAAASTCKSSCEKATTWTTSNACYRGERTHTHRRRDYTTWWHVTYADQRRWDNFVHWMRWENECGVGGTGPTQWGESPIAINPAETEVLPEPVQIKLGNSGKLGQGGWGRKNRLWVKNNGHAIEVEVCGANVDDCEAVLHAGDWPCRVHNASPLCGSNDTYTLAQFHFHFGEDNTKGSEHHMCGSPRVAEMHMVFLNQRWNSAENSVPFDLDNPDRGVRFLVLSTLIEVSDEVEDDPAFKPILDAVYFPEPRQADDWRDRGVAYYANTSGPSQGAVFMDQLLPEDYDTKFYTYAGGLTTPPCSQFVTWFVFENAKVWSQRQLDQLREATTWYEFPHGHAGPQTAIIFACVMLILGTATKQLLARYAPTVPYTMVCMLWGFAVNWIASSHNDGRVNPLQTSLRMWSNIDGHAVLYVWLPALLFGDMMKVDMHLFFQTFWQSFILAGPGVLISTFLVGLVIKYLLYASWTWPLCLALGAVLSATDPIAVVNLMKQLDAPKPLTMQMTGESLINDGTSVMLFSVFLDMSRNRRGQYADVWRLIRIATRFVFFSPCLGVLVGAVATYWMSKSSRRHSHNDVLVQISVTLIAAYLGFFLSDDSKVGQASGILATVAAAGVVAFRAWPFVISKAAMETVWETLEHVFNTLIFGLVGVIMSRGKLSHQVNGREVGNAFLLYVAVFLIRVVVVFGLLPFVNLVGPHKVSCREGIFLVWGGLRGVVALALAIVVKAVTSGSNRTWPHDRDQQAEHLMFVTAGVVFLSLLINAPTTRPLLKMFGLVYGSKADRYKLEVVDHVKERIVTAAESAYVKTCVRLRHNAIDVLQNTVILRRLRNTEYAEPASLIDADDVSRHEGDAGYQGETKEAVPELLTPRKDAASAAILDEAIKTAESSETDDEKKAYTVQDIKSLQSKAGVMEDPRRLEPLRDTFLRIVKAQYWSMIKTGELPRKAYATLLLLRSIDVATDGTVDAPLRDLAILQSSVDVAATERGEASGPMVSAVQCIDACTPTWFTSTSELYYKLSYEQYESTYYVLRAFSLAHKQAQRTFVQNLFGSAAQLDRPEELCVLAESVAQVAQADKGLASISDNLKNIVKSKIVAEAVTESAREALYVATEEGALSEADAKPLAASLDADAHALRKARKAVTNRIAKFAAQESVAMSRRSSSQPSAFSEVTDDDLERAATH